MEWKNLEADLGLILPPSYKSIVTTYGNGRFTRFFGIVSPFYTPPGHWGFKEFVRLRLEGVRLAQAWYPDYAVSLPVYPDIGGLFPWGYTDNGGTMFWLTTGDSSLWPVICLNNGYTADGDRFEVTIEDFIAQWLTNKISVPSLTPPDFFPLHCPVFVSQSSKRPSTRNP